MQLVPSPVSNCSSTCREFTSCWGCTVSCSSKHGAYRVSMTFLVMVLPSVTRFHWDWLRLWASWASRSCIENWWAFCERMSPASVGAAQGPGWCNLQSRFLRQNEPLHSTCTHTLIIHHTCQPLIPMSVSAQCIHIETSSSPNKVMSTSSRMSYSSHLLKDVQGIWKRNTCSWSVLEAPFTLKAGDYTN